MCELLKGFGSVDGDCRIGAAVFGHCQKAGSIVAKDDGVGVFDGGLVEDAFELLWQQLYHLWLGFHPWYFPSFYGIEDGIHPEVGLFKSGADYLL